MSSWETHRVAGLICGIAVLVVAGTSAFVLKGTAKNLSASPTPSTEPDLKETSKPKDRVPLDPMASVEFVSFKSGNDPSNFVGYFFSDPLTEMGAYRLGDHVLNSLMDKGTYVTRIILFGFYDEAEARYGESIGGGHDAVNMLWNKQNSKWNIRGFLTASKDPATILKECWEHDPMGDDVDIDRCRYIEKTRTVELVRRVFVRKTDDYYYGDDGPWFSVLYAMLECFAPSYRYSFWGMVPDIENLAVLLINDQSEEPIAKIRGSHANALRLRMLLKSKAEERQSLRDEESGLSNRFRAGAMSEPEYEQRRRSIMKRVVDWYTATWVEASQDFQVDILDDSYRRGAIMAGK